MSNTISLQSMFEDKKWQEVGPYCYFTETNNTKVGVVLATQRQGYPNFLINEGTLQRLLKGKLEGKIDQAFVVAAKLNGAARPTYFGQMDAEQLHKLLQG